MKTMILAAALAGALMLAGCGGGSKGGSVAGMPSGGEPSTPTPTPEPTRTYGPGTVPLPTGHTLETGTLPAGGSRKVGETEGMETVIRCTAGSENCRFTVAADGTVTLIAGSLRIEIVGIRVTPTTPTPPPTPVIEYPLITWRELPTSIDRMDHVTQIGSSDFPGSSCNGGVADCRTLMKGLLQYAGESEWDSEWRGVHPVKRFAVRDLRRYKDFHRTIPGFDDPPEIEDGYRRLDGGWLDNSIFLVETGAQTKTYSESRNNDPRYPRGPTYFDGLDTFYRMTSMGIRDTNPVVGVYEGIAIVPLSYMNFKLTYKTGATGHQIDMRLNIGPGLDDEVTWSNVPVDDNGGFDNGVRFPDKKMEFIRDSTGSGIDSRIVPHRLEGSFYQGGEVGGVFVYQDYQIQDWQGTPDLQLRLGPEPLRHFIHGAFGGKLVPDTP